MLMGLIDSHAHLTDESLLPQVEAVLARAAEAGVERIISVATDVPDALAALSLADRFPDRVYAAIGFHPHQAGRVTDEALAELTRLLDHPRVVGFGEMGLDYHYDFSDRPSQHRVFRAELELAVARDLPVIIHSREAFADTVGVLLEAGMAGRPVVFHCFSGTAEEAVILARHGWRASFTGVVTFRNASALQEIARTYPADQLMIETDCPYLSPVPVRGTRPNEPAFLAHTARFLANLREIDYESFVDQTRRNTVEFFKLRD